MKDPSGWTKVVIRHLPPALSQPALMEQIDSRFAGRYKWARFRPGKNSRKNQLYSLAYVDFSIPEDVVEFAEFFDGHIFVNEKGAQFKAVVEYAPSQRVPKPCPKKDGREGTLQKDPEYLEFLELISKPVEILPSAEIQLERRDAERVGAAKEKPIVTSLMEFVRQKRAAKIGFQRSSGNGKISRRSGPISANSSSLSSKRGSEKRRGPTSAYTVRDSTRNGGKNQPAYMLVKKRGDLQHSDKSVPLASRNRKVNREDGIVNNPNGAISGASDAVEIGKQKLILLRGKDREASPASVGLSQQHNITSQARNSPAAFKQNQKYDTNGSIIRTILPNKAGRQNTSFTVASQSDQTQRVNLEMNKHPHLPPTPRRLSRDRISSSSPFLSVSDSIGKTFLEDKVASNDKHSSAYTNENNDRRMRNKDRPDRGVWTPLRRLERYHTSHETPVFSSELSDSSQISIVQPAAKMEVGDDVVVQNAHLGRDDNLYSTYDTQLVLSDIKRLGGGRVRAPVENGLHRHIGCRVPAHGLMEVNNSLNLAEGQPPKRGSTGYGSHERQVWVQKSGSAS